MKKKMLGFVTVAAMTSMTLAACGNEDKEKTTGDGSQAEAVELSSKVENDKPEIDGGTLELAIVMDSPFKGMFIRELYEDAYDYDFISIAQPPIFAYDEDFRINDRGAAKLELDKENNKAKIKIKDEVKWSDGEPVTAEDLIYSYEIIGHQDYTGVRYDDNMTNIIGMEEYHEGKADTISGLKALDDKTLEIEFKEVHPGMETYDGGIWPSVAPKHQLKDIPVKDLESSDEVRVHPLSFGPYVIDKVTPGEAVQYVPNEYYYGDRSKIEKVILTVIPTSASIEALKAKQYDMVFKMPTDTFPSYKDIEGYQNLGREELAYSYIGFKLGKWNDEKGEVETDPNAKMADKKLRQAMGYAVDNDAIGEKFYHGLRSGATTLIPPIFKAQHDDSIEGYQYDIEKAKELLDEAGYKYEKEGDTYRKDPEGNDLVIKFASMSGGETAQPIADYYIQQWKEIGLNVELTGGRLIDFQSFYDKVKNDDPDIDIYQAAWGLSEYPSPAGLYGAKAAFNYTRFSSEENTKLINEIDSKESFDLIKQKEFFDKWQQYAFEEAFAIPTLYRTEVLPVSDRVKDFSWDYSEFSEKGFSTLKLTDEKR